MKKQKFKKIVYLLIIINIQICLYNHKFYSFILYITRKGSLTLFYQKCEIIYIYKDIE